MPSHAANTDNWPRNVHTLPRQHIGSWHQQGQSVPQSGSELQQPQPSSLPQHLAATAVAATAAATFSLEPQPALGGAGPRLLPAPLQLSRAAPCHQCGHQQLSCPPHQAQASLCSLCAVQREQSEPEAEPPLAATAAEGHIRAKAADSPDSLQSEAPLRGRKRKLDPTSLASGVGATNGGSCSPHSAGSSSPAAATAPGPAGHPAQGFSRLPASLQSAMGSALDQLGCNVVSDAAERVCAAGRNAYDASLRYMSSCPLPSPRMTPSCMSCFMDRSILF